MTIDNHRLAVRKIMRYFLLGQVLSAGLILLGFVFINERQDQVLQITGWLFLTFGIVFLLIIRQRQQRLLWIYRNTSPVPMKMKLEKTTDSDSLNYFACLTGQENNNPVAWKARLYPPAGDVQAYLQDESQVQVYLDPKNNQPAVIETTSGLLWVMAGSGAVQKLTEH